MDTKKDRKGSIKKSVIFYLVISIVVLASLYFFELSAALIAYSIIILIAYISKKQDGDFWWGVSWKPGFMFGLILISSIFILELWLGWIELEGLSPDLLYILIGAVIFEVLVTLGEEMSFRGYILPNLIESLGLRNAIITTSLLFALLHIPSILFLGIGKFNTIIMFASIIMAGILMSILYLIGGLKMSSGFHFSWNFFQYHIFSLRGGFGIFGLTAMKPEFTGGSVGPEAGIFGLFVLMLGILILLVFVPFSKE
ncbi:MAG: CPBP family intramembrane metalloprotease [Candidatus Methanoperedens sp.]|nr:CPBP family intramembrane metalloprotease [Candidatus Methanoperedens sp.]